MQEAGEQRDTTRRRLCLSWSSHSEDWGDRKVMLMGTDTRELAPQEALLVQIAIPLITKEIHGALSFYCITRNEAR